MPTKRESKYLKPIYKNPWYILATVEGDATDELVFESTRTNKSIWNRYVSRILTKDQRRFLLDEGWISEKELNPISDDELLHFWQLRTASIAGEEAINPPELGTPENPNPITFERADFHRGFLADGYLFPMPLIVCSCEFKGLVNLTNSVFLSACFFEDNSFLSAIFMQNAKLQIGAIFRKSEFRTITMNNSSFAGPADFSDSKFEYVSSFMGCEVAGEADFSNSTFHRQAMFSGAKFLNKSSFMNSTFHSTTDFSESKFGFAPYFQGSKLHPDTIWPDQQKQIYWPDVPKNGLEAMYAERAWASLKWAMNQVQRHDAELDFFARELEAKKVSLNWMRARVIDLYKILSNYGRSALRPFFWWLMAYVFAFAINVLSFPKAEKGEDPVDVLTVASFTLGNAFPFGRETSVAEELIEIPRWLDFVSAGHTFLSLLFIFLIGLALRNRLRIK